MPFHIDGAEGTGRTEVLASTATDTTLGVDNGYLHRMLVGSITGHHLDGSCRTMAGTIATIHPISQGYAVFPHPNGMTDTGGRFLFTGNGTDGIRRTHIGTAGTLGTTVAPLIRCLGLHQPRQVTAGTQHTIGTGRDTQLTGRAMLGKMPGTEGSGRKDGHGTMGSHLVLDGSQSAIHLLLLCIDGGRCGYQCRGCEEGTATLVRGGIVR